MGLRELYGNINVFIFFFAVVCPIYLYRVPTRLSVRVRVGGKTKRVKNGCDTDGGNKTQSEKNRTGCRRLYVIDRRRRLRSTLRAFEMTRSQKTTNYSFPSHYPIHLGMKTLFKQRSNRFLGWFFSNRLYAIRRDACQGYYTSTVRLSSYRMNNLFFHFFTFHFCAFVTIT